MTTICCERAKVLAGTLMCPRHGSVFTKATTKLARPKGEPKPRPKALQRPPLPKVEPGFSDDALCEALVAMLTQIRDAGYRPAARDEGDEMCANLIAVLERIKASA